jgi:hypothetical protein
MGHMLLEPSFEARSVTLPTELVVRASTGPARQNRRPRSTEH